MNKHKVFNTRAILMISVTILFTISLMLMLRIGHDSFESLGYDLINNQLESEIEIISGSMNDNYWYLNQDGFLCNGDNVFGDGNEKNSNCDYFLKFQDITSTFSYIFILDDEHEYSYDEGHYKCVAGSIESSKENSIIGTYIQKEVSDALDETGVYKGTIDASDNTFYCLYNAIYDANGNIIGAIVVGQNMSELNTIIQVNSIYQTAIFILIFLILFMIVNIILNFWIKNIKNIDEYVNNILTTEYVPDKKLDLVVASEFSNIVDNINELSAVLKENKILQKKSETDPLTGIYNRFGLESEYMRIFNECVNNNEPIGFEIIDIDYFKQYNDTYGHKQGDICIIEVSKILNDITKQYPLSSCARFGGDEFVLLYHNYNEATILEIEKTIHENVHKLAMEHMNSKVNSIVTVTQGACVFEYIDSDMELDDLLKVADSVLYEIKQGRKDSFGINLIER